MAFNIHRLFPVQASPADIFQAITTQEGITSWWVETCKVKPEPGFINEFIFGDRYHNKMRVAELIPNEKVVWKVLESADDWLGTKITFRIFEKEGMIFVAFSHEGYPAQNDFFATCIYNWSRYMKSLKAYCETGKGDPFVEDVEMDEVDAVKTDE